ncbi:MAG TPA: sigma-54 dependent transcriptional regulator [Methylomirabilota bacterium]|nr:sigma-54 dependent transcriptional regulator [Methylomirabilota bacterium]
MRDFSVLMGRSVDEIVAAIPVIRKLGLARIEPDPDPASVAIVLEPLPKPHLALLRKALEVPRRSLRLASGASFGDEELIGLDEKMREVYRLIERVSRTNATVLIQGESGTGKELVARAIHRQSNRADGQFVVIDCAAIAPALLESELFGHEKGSFTTALKKKIGKFEEAEGGTIFLDEIAELPIDLQAKLLRVVQTRQFTRVGGTQPIRIDVRFLTATNRDLKEQIRLGRFREDLFYRLNVITITLPPLRERKGDIPLLVDGLIRRLSEKNQTPARGVSKLTLERLMNYHWPGNVRELENALERALILAQSSQIQPEDLPLGESAAPQNDNTKASGPFKSLKEVEAEQIRRVLEALGGNESQAARVLGIHRDTLYRKIRRYHIVAR